MWNGLSDYVNSRKLHPAGSNKRNVMQQAFIIIHAIL